ncbi:hypothetical protein L3Q67_27005 [Saccharothrix sp. AJ9571]|nr:hypothetical protein L3Q67_27005 [Saccharothrix sp. AJ9571]
MSGDEPTTHGNDSDFSTSAGSDPVMRRANESLGRRTGDLDLLEELRVRGFEGPSWQRFAEELARYGWAVMQAWLVSGEIFAQCALRRRSVGTAPLYWTEDDRFSLAQDTVVEGLRLFRERGLVQGGWNIDGGASLRTFFIGACVLVFPNVYRTWRKRHNDERTASLVPNCDAVDWVDTSASDPAMTAVHRDEAWAALRAMPLREKRAVLLQELGYGRIEIGELLALADGEQRPYSEATVAGWLRRQRQRSRDQREEGERR